MVERSHSYVIVGGGLAAASAVEGIRERDPKGSILVLCREKHLPYDRPPLTKKLWFGKKQLADIVLHDAGYYERHDVDLVFGASVVKVDRARRAVRDREGNEYLYDKLLLATGGTPRRLTIPGGDEEGILYYRNVDDYASLRTRAQSGASALVIGGGFIGSELSAALCQNEVEVTLLFPGRYLCARVFPEALGRAVERRYGERGVRIVSEDRPTSIVRRGGGFAVRTAAGRDLASDIVVVGIGIDPAVELARDTGLTLENGVVVDERLRTSDPDIYAAGDIADFQYPALGKRMRVEHWDNARAQGTHAGRNMAGAAASYDYMPMFFSDLFEFGYEAIGEVDARLTVTTDWRNENEKGVIYYACDGRVRGVMMCNVWDRVDEARALIRSEQVRSAEALRGAIAPASP